MEQETKKPCELCKELTEHRTGCYKCARLVCDECLAASSEDEDEPCCETCF